MLKQLHISNYALIDHLNISFENGFSVLTGETGSGKSIILGALSLLSGERADSKTLRNKDLKCVVEGVFYVAKSPQINEFFELNDLDFLENTIIRREINPQGKSRSFINDTPVNLNVIKHFGDQLIDIHSQHENTVLNDKSFLFKIIDSKAATLDLLKEYQMLFLELKKNQEILLNLEEKEYKAQQEKDYQNYLLSEFENIDIAAFITNDIESLYQQLTHSDEIIKLASESVVTLDDSSNSVVIQLMSAANALEKLSKLSPDFAELFERTHSCLIELCDIASDLNRKNASLDFDTSKLNYYEDIINSINKLIKKHNLRNVEELQSFKNTLIESIENSNSIASEITKTNLVINKLSIEVTKKGESLRKKRHEIFKEIETEVNTLLHKMNMKNAQIQLTQTPLEKPSFLGLDDVTILAKTNLGSAFEPLKKIASGGELSRIMLSIKSLQSKQNAIPTVIFDEIDTGVSGEVANAMGDIMLGLSAQIQVIAITHLPQIAGKGNYHFKVFKEERNNTTQTYLQQLNPNQRIVEIAEMISGKNPSENAIANAKELLL